MAVKIAVFGAGAVGGYFGGRLALAGNDVTFIARGAHLAAIRSAGLRVRGVRGEFTVNAVATGDPTGIGPCDVVLFCVKSYDTQAAAALLAPLLAEQTAVVSLQNGVDNEEKIAGIIGQRHVLGGVALIFANVAEPGVIVDGGGPGQILFGELDGRRSDRVERLLAACQAAGVDAQVPADIRVALWSKLAFICAQAGMTAASRLPLAEIRACPQSWAMFRCILDEVAMVGRAEGVPLSDGLVDGLLQVTETLEPDSRSSLYHDLVGGRRMELDALHGVVVDRAGRHDIAVPASEAVYALLRPWALRAETAAAPAVR